MTADKVLVLCATGKVGRNVSRALVEAGFTVYGTTRRSPDRLRQQGVIPIACDYTKAEDLDRALVESGAKKLFVITDFFAAAGRSVARERQQGRRAFEAAKRAKVEHLIFMSVADAECFDDKTEHIKAKVQLEADLRDSGLAYSILRPCAFFENLDDASNWNPLKRGVVKFLTDQPIKYCSTYDIGRAAALLFRDPRAWAAKSLDVISWQGDLAALARALEAVSGEPVRHGLIMPIWLRRLLLNDLHHMFLYFERDKGPKGEPEAFRQIVPDALSAEAWFRFHNRYANGEPIVAPQPAP